MTDSCTWFDPVTLSIGAEATWDDSALRLRLDGLSLERGLLSRWFGKHTGPAICRLQLTLVTRDRPASERSVLCGFPKAFPMLFGPLLEDRPLLAEQYGAQFEVTALHPQGHHARCRAGYATLAPDVRVQGDLTALDPLAQRIIGGWLERPASQLWMSTAAPPRAPCPLPGFGLVLAPRSTGSLTVSFHCQQDRYFARAYGGCLAPVETWYGPL